MSPILDLQQRLQEVGRIRMGAQVPYTKQDGTIGQRPAKLPHWRLTSRDQLRLEAVAVIYGGEVKLWAAREGEYEVYTTTDTLRCLIIPGQALTAWWEMWGGGGCLRRCDGYREVLSDGPCLCPADYDERTEQSNANPPKACKPTTRLAVLLPDVPGIGHWRLETHGYYAAVELAAAHGLLEEATRRGALLPARLRIDVRSKLAGGRTTKYPVPVVDLDIALPELMQLSRGAGEGEILGLPAPAEGFTPVPPEAQRQPPGVVEGLASTTSPAQPRAPRANAAAGLGPAAPPPQGAALPVEDPVVAVESAQPATAAQPAAAQPAPAAEEADAEVSLGPVLPVEAPPAAAPPAEQPVAAPEPPAAAPVQAAAPAGPAAAAGATAALSVAMANQRQRRLLWATVRDRGMSDEQLRGILQEVTGQESTASIPVALFEAVLTSIQGAALVEGGTPA